MTLYENRVMAGIAWLKENVPGGVERIRAEFLDIQNPCLCALSQATGMMFSNACAKYGLNRFQQTELGFNIDMIDWSSGWLVVSNNQGWIDLNEAWRKVLAEEVPQSKEVEITWIVQEEQHDNADSTDYFVSHPVWAYCPSGDPADDICYPSPRQGVGRLTVLDCVWLSRPVAVRQGLGEPSQVTIIS